MGGSLALAVSSQGGAVAWLVPTYRNSRPLWRFSTQMVGDLRKHKLVDTNKSDLVINFKPTGGMLSIYTGDNIDAIRGESFDLIIADEAARLKEDSWTDAVQPTLADRGGRAILISTPKGRNWFWREYMAADGEHQASWQAPSCDNPMPSIKQAYELAKTRVPERTFLQEWNAEFVEDAGVVFRRVRDAVRATPQHEPIPDHQYVMGVDFGKHEDFTVITVVDLATNEVVYLDRFNQIDYVLQLNRIRATSNLFSPDAIIAEVNSMGEPLIEQLQREDFPVVAFKTTNASKAVAIEALALAFEQGEIAILDDPVLIDELQSFSMERLPSGLTRYSAPQGLHDDTVMSLAFAWHGAGSAAGSWEFV